MQTSEVRRHGRGIATSVARIANSDTGKLKVKTCMRILMYAVNHIIMNNAVNNQQADAHHRLSKHELHRWYDILVRRGGLKHAQEKSEDGRVQIN